MITRQVLFSLAIAAPLLSAGPATAQQHAVSMALDWTPNTNHIGLFVARAKGFYEEAGVEVQILPYADTAAGTLVANGVSDFGHVSSMALFAQRAAGADLIATYAVSQSETGRLVFDGNRDDIERPSDLDGMIYAGFGSDWERALISAMIQHDGGQGEFEIVTLGTSAYEALANGAVDFTLEVATWEGVRADLDGRPQGAFYYGDYGVPDQHTGYIATRESWLEDNREAAQAFIQATQRGYAYAVDNPDEATDILISENPDALTDRDFVRASLQALIDGNFLRSEDGAVGVLNAEKMEAMGSFLYENAILRDMNGSLLSERPDFSAFYTNELF